MSLVITQPCFPDFVEQTKHALPALGVILAVLSYLALVVLLLWAPKLRRKWMRITSRILGWLGLVSIIASLPVILFAILLDSGNPPTKSVAIRSTGGQEATLKYSGGFLGRDYTEVILKRPDSCRHFTIFWHAGPSYENDVKVLWIDDHHLRLTYHTRRDDPQHCDTTSGDVNIVCSPTPWPN